MHPSGAEVGSVRQCFLLQIAYYSTNYLGMLCYISIPNSSGGFDRNIVHDVLTDHCVWYSILPTRAD